MRYRGLEIELNEAPEYREQDYNVTANGIIYRASSVAGESYALTPDLALDGAKRQIDAQMDQYGVATVLTETIARLDRGFNG
jgi:hypothetical protein